MQIWSSKFTTYLHLSHTFVNPFFPSSVFSSSWSWNPKLRAFDSLDWANQILKKGSESFVIILRSNENCSIYIYLKDYMMIQTLTERARNFPEMIISGSSIPFRSIWRLQLQSQFQFLKRQNHYGSKAPYKVNHGYGCCLCPTRHASFTWEGFRNSDIDEQYNHLAVDNLPLYNAHLGSVRSPSRRTFLSGLGMRNFSQKRRFDPTFLQLLSITNDRWAFANIALQVHRLRQKWSIPICDFLITHKNLSLECKKLRQHLQHLFCPFPWRPQEIWLLSRETLVHVFVEVYCEATHSHGRIAWLSHRLVWQVLFCQTGICEC